MAVAIIGALLALLSCPVQGLGPTAFCPAGQYSSSVVCFNCLPGTYSDTPGSSACLYCPPGTYDDTTGGATSCSSCIYGPAYGLGRTGCESCNSAAMATMNISYVADTLNKYIREISLGGGYALDPALSNYVKGSTNTNFNIFFSVDGSNLMVLWQGRQLLFLDVVDGGVGVIAGSSWGYVDGTNANTLFYDAGNGVMGKTNGWNAIFLVESNRVRKGSYFGNSWITLIGSAPSSNCYATDPVPIANLYFLKATGIYVTPSEKFMFIIDQSQQVLYHINLVSNLAYVVAGTCRSAGSDDGPGLKARFNNPTDIQVAPDESFAIISDTGNFVFRKLVFSNISDPYAPITVTTVIGTVGQSGDVNGQGAAVRIGTVTYFGLSPTGSLLLFGDNNQVKMADVSVFPYQVQTHSGNSTPGLGFGPNTMYNQPRRVSSWACQIHCPANYYVIVGTTFCTPCPPNSFSAPRAPTCTPYEGYFVNGSALSALSTGRCPGASQCSAGTYMAAPCTASTDVVCAACPSGTYSSASSAFCSTCKATCPLGTYYTYACNSTSDRGCPACPAGLYTSNTDRTYCSTCWFGAFSLPGASTCTRCQAGSYAQDGSSACTLCAAGTFAVGFVSVCTQCPVNTFSGLGVSACVGCQAGTYFAVSGSTTSCAQCTAGSYSNAGSSTCILCQPGSFSAPAAAACTGCSAGTFSAITGASAISFCTTCSKGSYSLPGSSACTPCPAWLDTVSTGATDASQCSICRMGASTATGACAWCGENSYSNSTDASTCTTCPSSQFAPVGSTACQTCSAGSYLFSPTVASPTAAQNYGGVSYPSILTPLTAGVGQYCSNYRAASTLPAWSDQCQSVFNCPWKFNAGCWYIYNVYSLDPEKVICDAGCMTTSSCTGVANGVLTTPGTIGDPNSCQIQCNPGYKLQNRQCVFIGNCDLCPIGKYTQYAGSLVCTTCPGGSFANSPGSTACSSCITCTDGYYSANCGESGGVCTQCPAGYYSRAGATVCTSCPLGTYSATPGATTSATCIACAIGTYANATASACTQCPAWYTTETTGAISSTSCNTCTPGASSATGVCAACSNGKYTGGLNATECVNCLPGEYSTAGSSACLFCSAGKYLFSGSIALPGNPVPASTASYLPSFNPLILGAGQYCSEYSNQRTYTLWDTDAIIYESCNIDMDPGFTRCPWVHGPSCSDPYFIFRDSQGRNQYGVNCAGGCKTALPCTNAIGNSSYTGPGTNNNPLSCQWACNPGYMLVNGACLLVGHCSNCTVGTYSPPGVTACAQCSEGKYADAPGSTSCGDCVKCPAGLYAFNCGPTQGVCVRCNNTA